ncbi:MAG: homocysteine S-methyltransferase family protein [Pseudomonadota bacterium]
MSKYRSKLPQLDGTVFLTDGGIETTLIFHEGFELPHFAAFDLLRDQEGRQALRRYYERYAEIARANEVGFVLESATWRASRDWGDKLGYSADDIAKVNQDAISLLSELRNTFETGRTQVVISGCIGPRGDGYDPGEIMTSAEAQVYHEHQIKAFADSEADMVTAITMTNINEAVGIARAASEAGMPSVISFTVETDGRLPTGDTLQYAISTVDRLVDNPPAYYMINCAHPSHFEGELAGDDHWLDRIRGVRANASSKSHAELDEAVELDIGNPQELGSQHQALRGRLKRLNVFGGCCGTDHRHIAAIADACLAA